MDRKSYGQKLKLKMWAIKIELKFYEKLFKSEGYLNNVKMHRKKDMYFDIQINMLVKWRYSSN
jgi:hypothetical protein